MTPTGYLRHDGSYGIRRYRETDVEPFFEAAVESTEEVYPWLPWCRPDFSLEDARAWVESRAKAWREESEFSFVIAHVGSGTFVGGVGINRVDRGHGVGNLAYWVRTRWTGRGAGTTAIRLAADYGLAELGLERVEIVAIAENQPSRRVAEKAGAKREGLLRRKLRARERSWDSVMYSIVRGDV